MTSHTTSPKPIHSFSGLLVLLFLTSLLLQGCDQPPSPSKTQENTEPALHYAGTIIAVGDSLTAGLGVNETEAWPALLEQALQQKGYNWQVINAGVSGETSSGALSRMKWIIAQKPDLVILETGANDGLRGIAVPLIEKNISQCVQMLQKSGITVVLTGMQIVQNLGEEYTTAFADVYPRVARQYHCLLIPFLLNGVAGEPDLNQADTIHPNPEGHRIVAQTATPYIIQALQRKE